MEYFLLQGKKKTRKKEKQEAGGDTNAPATKQGKFIGEQEDFSYVMIQTGSGIPSKKCVRKQKNLRKKEQEMNKR